MAQHRSGTIATTSGSQTITGTGTKWLEPDPITGAIVAAGDEINIDGDGVVWYKIGAIVSNTEITLAVNYPVTRSDADYVINTDFTPNCGFPVFEKGDLHFPEGVSRFAELADKKISGEVGTRTIIVENSGGIVAGQVVVEGTTEGYGIPASSANEGSLIGVAMDNGDMDDQINVRILGPQSTQADSTVTRGEFVNVAGSSGGVKDVSETSATVYVLGKAREDAGASGGDIIVDVNPHLSHVA